MPTSALKALTNRNTAKLFTLRLLWRYSYSAVYK